MALDAAQFKAAIEALSNGSDLLNFHVSAVEAEKSRGIEESRKANAEAQALRRYKIALEKLPGFDKDADLDKFVDSIKTVTTKAGEADNTKLSLDQVVAELNKLRTDYTKTTAELAAEKARADEIKADSIKKTLRSKLVPALAEKIYGHDFVADHLITTGAVVLGDDESVQFVDGDKRIDMAAGLQRLLTGRPDIVKNSSRPGAGTAPPSGQGAKKFTPEQIQGMSKAEITANLADVKASLGIGV